MQRVKSLEHLKKECFNTGRDCFIQLNGGIRSSKYISFDGREFVIEHLIDGSYEQITPRKLMSTNIGEAIKQGALFIQN